MNNKYNLSYLVGVDEQIKFNENLISDTLWETEEPNAYTDMFLDSLKREVERLRSLQADGVVYEPLF